MMTVFANLEDTPMFRKQLSALEASEDELKDRCHNFYKGNQRFMSSLGIACDGYTAFAESLEAFGAGCDDPMSVAIGGPVMSKFTTAFRELGTYKELLCSQVEHMLGNRLVDFINTDLKDAKDCQRQFAKAQQAYDQARDKVMSLRKGTRPDLVSMLEEDLDNTKSAFERCRFNLVNALANIESKKKYEFLESASAVMDAHLRYFKQGHELLSQLEPFIHEILTYSQQLKEMASTEHDNLSRRIQEFRTQEAHKNLRSQSKNNEKSANGDGIHIVGVNSYKKIEALMQSSEKGEVQTLKQGYLLKRSSGLRGDWNRRFFVLNSHGKLYYYKNKRNKRLSAVISERGTGVLGRFRLSNQRPSSHGEEESDCHKIDLQTATVKIDAEETDLRFCFRIISPLKMYTLQAENGQERTEWVDKITAVIASLLHSSFMNEESCSSADGGDSKSSEKHDTSNTLNNIIQHDAYKALKNIPGNDVCAECNFPGPDWASLNIGILLCIECSGVHRNLGVHISKVRSLTLDVKVWESTILDLFRVLGNSYCNSVWEELLELEDERRGKSDKLLVPITKPGPQDSISVKEKYIQLKYVEKCFVAKEITKSIHSCAALFWESVKSGNIRAVYRLLITSEASPNMLYEMAYSDDSSHLMDIKRLSEDHSGKKQYDPSNCQKINDIGEPSNCLEGSSPLHLACHIGDIVMVELLLQFGADINMKDFHGRTPLHHCVFKRNDVLAKYLIKRGANPSIRDGGNQTALERAMDFGPVADEELFLLLVESH